MREINVEEIKSQVRGLCIDANLKLSPEMEKAISAAKDTEKNPLAVSILDQLQENMEIAKNDGIPICQDTGMAVFFIELGQDVHIVGGDLTEAINEGVRQGYTEGYLRKSVVGDPLLRENTKDNTPAIIHYDIVPGDKLKITITPKGFGSENMSKLVMLKPADGVDGIKQVVIDAAKNAGPNACPPFVLGVGIGGDFELVAKLAKKALTREPGSHNPQPHIAELEKELLNEINSLGIGPAGLGGSTTALAVNIETYATHIAGLPIAVNMCCHVDRHKSVVL
ncbi:MAG: fumarate hydratase [Eubacterium sp.]|nr:fumarate hydratase [Eubacterium sp.]